MQSSKVCQGFLSTIQQINSVVCEEDLKITVFKVFSAELKHHIFLLILQILLE
jgi:hypothetical protein